MKSDFTEKNRFFSTGHDSSGQNHYLQPRISGPTKFQRFLSKTDNLRKSRFFHRT